MLRRSARCWNSWGILCRWHLASSLPILTGWSTWGTSFAGMETRRCRWMIRLPSFQVGFCAERINPCLSLITIGPKNRRRTANSWRRCWPTGRSCGNAAGSQNGSLSRRFPSFSHRQHRPCVAPRRSWSWRYLRMISTWLPPLHKRETSGQCFTSTSVSLLGGPPATLTGCGICWRLALSRLAWAPMKI